VAEGRKQRALHGSAPRGGGSARGGHSLDDLAGKPADKPVWEVRDGHPESAHPRHFGNVPMSRHERFELLYETHYPAVLAYALRRAPSRADAYDVCAETFLVAWRRVDDLPGNGHTVVWLYGVCRRLLSNTRRSSRRRAQLVSKLEAQPIPPSRSAPVFPTEDDHDHVLQALGRLRPLDQEILRLSTWEGLSNRELGWFLGCNETAAATRASRARKRLKVELGKTAKVLEAAEAVDVADQRPPAVPDDRSGATPEEGPGR